MGSSVNDRFLPLTDHALRLADDPPATSIISVQSGRYCKMNQIFREGGKAILMPGGRTFSWFLDRLSCAILGTNAENELAVLLGDTMAAAVVGSRRYRISSMFRRSKAKLAWWRLWKPWPQDSKIGQFPFSRRYGAKLCRVWFGELGQTKSLYEQSSN